MLEEEPIPLGFEAKFEICIAAKDRGNLTSPFGSEEAVKQIVRAIKKAAIEEAKVARKAHKVKIALKFNIFGIVT